MSATSAPAQPQPVKESAAPLDMGAVAAWLIDGARSASRAEDVLTELCNRLAGCGLPLWRVAVYVNTLHPQILARRFLWRPGGVADVAEAPFEMASDDAFRGSPITRIRTTGETIRRRLADPGCPMDFKFLDDMRSEEVTDYLAAPLRFTNGEIHAASFTTRQAGGFTDAQVAEIEAILPPLSRVAEVRALRRTAISLLDAYVGHDAGERILAGRIRRGDTETIRAVIWLSDMRGFTALADRVPPQALIELLNRFYDCLVPPIEAEGGEVLKFMGDGLLAIFRIADDAPADEACARALRAARQAQGEDRGVAGRQRRGERGAAALRARSACRRGALRQYRRGRPPRFHLHRPGRQHGGAHREARQQARPRDPRIDQPSPGICRPSSRRWGNSNSPDFAAPRRCSGCTKTTA